MSRLRRVISIGLLACLPSGTQPEFDALRQSALGFEKYWNTYIRKLFGCPLEGPTDKEHCTLSLASIDYTAYRKAREEAKKMFILEEK